VIQKLQRNIKKFEQFRINYGEYIKFKRRLVREVKEAQEQEWAEVAALEKNRESMDVDEFNVKIKAAKVNGISRVQSDLRFTYDFVQDLIKDAQFMDIDIFSQRTKANPTDKPSKNIQSQEAVESKPRDSPKFDIEKLKLDIENYNQFKNKFMALLSELESEVFDKQTHQALQDVKDRGLLDQYYQMRADITKLPIYERQTYKRVQAFVWIFNAYDLLATGVIEEDSPFHVQVDQRRSAKPSDDTSHFMSIKQWKDFIKQHQSFLSIFPDLGEHSIVQQLLWEVQSANRLIDHVKDQRQMIQNLTHLFMRGPDYYKHLASYQFESNFHSEQQIQMREEKKARGLAFLPGRAAEIDYEDPSTNEYIQKGIIGPKIHKQHLMVQFEKKATHAEFLERKRRAEKIQINLQEEKKSITKWISEYEELLMHEQSSAAGEIQGQQQMI